MVLLDLLHAPDGSYLASLATLMARVENLSDVLAWAGTTLQRTCARPAR